MDSHNYRRQGGEDWRPFILSGLHGINPNTTHTALNFDPSNDNFRGWAISPQEADLRTHIIRLINSGDWDSLNPNSGQSVEVANQSVCVAYREDSQSGYRTWEWHGHFLVYDGRLGYTTEYFYGNYPQPMEKKDNARR